MMIKHFLGPRTIGKLVYLPRLWWTEVELDGSLNIYKPTYCWVATPCRNTHGHNLIQDLDLFFLKTMMQQKGIMFQDCLPLKPLLYIPTTEFSCEVSLRTILERYESMENMTVKIKPPSLGVSFESS